MSAPVRQRGGGNPWMAEIADLRAKVHKLEAAQVRVVEAPVTAADTTSSTFTVSIAGGVDGTTQSLSGIAAPPQFMPDPGQTVKLTVAGPQPIFNVPPTVAADSITYRELDSTISTDITGAVTSSTQAVAAANGKNNVTYSPNVAASTTPGKVAGDTWFQRNASGVIIGQWEWTGTAWASRTLSDLVISSVTAGKIVTGTLSATMTVTGAIQSSATGKRWTADANGIRLYDGVSTTPVIDLNSGTGSAVFRGVVEGALIRTSSTGQRLEIQSGSRAVTFYPVSASGGAASFYSADDGSGNAGVTATAGSTNAKYGFLNFTSTFADIGYWEGSPGTATAWLRANPSASTYGIQISTGKEVSITTPRVRFFDGSVTYAALSSADGMARVGKFSLNGPADLGGAGPQTAFTFGQGPGGTDADLYGLRFISTNPGGTGGFVYFSDQRLKTNIKTAQFSALKQLLSIPVRSFDWAATGISDVGFIAQEVPVEAQVHLSPDAPLGGIADPMGVSTDKLVVWLIKALQEIAVLVNYKPPA